MRLTKRCARLGAVLLILLALTACNRSGGSPASESDASPSAVATASPQAMRAPVRCADSKPIDAGDHDRSLSAGGLDRTYILHVPPSYDGVTPQPLVLNFHGYGSNSRQQATYSRFPAAADANGFLVVTPDGAGTPQQWNIGRLPALPDDIAFARALLDALERDLCVDASRVYTAGISNGAAFSQQVACAMPDRIAGVAVVAALFYPLTCNAAGPIPVIAFHGTADACVPYDGGPVTCGSGRNSIPPIEDSALNWARHDGCNELPARQRLTDHVRTIAYSECDGETAVVLFVIEDGGHTWPGSADVGRLGATTHEIDATEQIWQFFEAQAALRASR
jgi:polyhydroxybutyrate depolymerase